MVFIPILQIKSQRLREVNKIRAIRSKKESKARQSDCRTLVLTAIQHHPCTQSSVWKANPVMSFFQLKAQPQQWFSNTLIIKVLTVKRDLTPHHTLASSSLPSLSFSTCTHIILVHKFKPWEREAVYLTNTQGALSGVVEDKPVFVSKRPSINHRSKKFHIPLRGSYLP